MGEMQFSILNSHYQQYKWAGPIYNSYHSTSSSSHPSYIPWEPYPVNHDTNSYNEKRYNTLESVLLGEIPASYSHLTTTSPHLSSSPSTASSSSSSSPSVSSSPCTSSDGSYSASPHQSQSPTPLLLQKEIIRPAATGLSEYQSEPMDLSCKTPGSTKNDNICYTDDRSFLETAASYSYQPHHDSGVTDCSLLASHTGGQTFISPEKFEQTQQHSSPVHRVMQTHSPEHHSHLHCQQPMLSSRHSPVQQLHRESPIHHQQQPSHRHQESPIHYQLSPEHMQAAEHSRHSGFRSVTPQEIPMQQQIETKQSCHSPMQLCPPSSSSCSSRPSTSSPSSSSPFHLHHTTTSTTTAMESTQSLYEAQSLQCKSQSILPPQSNSPSSVDPYESSRPSQTTNTSSSQFSKTAGHSLLRDLLSCGRSNKSQENGLSPFSSENSRSFSSSPSSSEDDSVLSCPSKPKEEYVGSKDYSLCSTTRVTLAKKNLLPISARVTEWLYKMVKFAKEIPQFVKLPNNDRLTLILNSWTRLLLMHMAENNFQFAVTPLPSSPEHKTDEAPASDEPTMKSVESVQSFIRKCQCMNLDTSEFEYLRMLVLFNAGYVGLEMSSVVDNMNSSIQQHLQQHIHTKHPRDHIRFSRVLMCLPSLYGINCKMIDNLFCGFIHGKTDIEVLLKDMLQDL